MKISIIFIVTLFITNCMLGQETNKILLGSWTKSKIEETNTLNENWLFQTSNKGIWGRTLIMTDSAIICEIKNPFTWTLTKKTELRITFGKTTCTCKARESRFEKGLDGFIKDYKSTYDNSYDKYDLQIVDNDTIKFDNLRLDRKKN